MPEDQTWESAATETPPPPAAPVAEPEAIVEPPVVPSAEAPTLEATPQLEVGPVVRESESPEPIVPEPAVAAAEPAKDEDVEEGDAPEILALPTGSSSRKWARRQFHDAAPVRDFLDFDKPIAVVGDELFKRSASRYTEHVNDLVTRHSDHVSKQLFGVSHEEAKARLQPTAPAATTPSEIDVSLPTVEQLNEMTNEQVIETIQKIQQKDRERISAEFQSKVDGLQSQFDAVNGKLTTEEQKAQAAEISDNQNKLLNNVLSVVDEGLRNSGLEVKPDDPPRIANLKRAAARLLDKQPVLAAFDAIPENTNLVKYVTEAINRKEYQNAFREEDNLKVRARAAFESVKQSPEVKAIFDEIEVYALQSKGKSRATDPVPPAPGSSLGVVVKPPTTWDEAQAAA